MSLLLDALKKAADDKQKVSQSEAASAESAAIQASLQLVEEAASRSGMTSDNETSSFSESLLQEMPQQADADELDDSEALSLDPVASVQSESALTFDETDIESGIENGSAGPEQQAEKKDKKPAGSKVASNNSVSVLMKFLLVVFQVPLVEKVSIFL